MRNKKVEVLYYKSPTTGLKRFNPWGAQEKRKTFKNSQLAKRFAKKISRKKGIFVSSLAYKN